MRTRGVVAVAVAVAVLGVLACNERAASGADPTSDDASAGAAGDHAGAIAGHGGAGGQSGAGGAEGGAGSGSDEPTTLNAPLLVSPADGAADVPVRTPLCWEPVALAGARYHVFVDELQLVSGKVGVDGFAGPCTEPLAFEPGREYRWHVIAFDPQPGGARTSPASATFVFATAEDLQNRVVFADDFDDATAPAWTTSGDAAQGGWVRGTPEGVEDDGAPSQPGACNDGAGCFFTAHNPEAEPDDEDVAGGSVVLESPSFDLSGANGVTVSLARFFHRSDSESSGARLQVELRFADPSAPDGQRVRVLEALEGGQASATNAWTSVSFALCDPPFGGDARLRITASDLTEGVVEAAIDSVVVTTQANATGCARGQGALCDPAAATPCEGDLLCCGQGTLHHGVHRCVPPARAIDPASPQEEGEPNAGALGCPLPDLTVVADPDSVRIASELFEAGSCALRERCVGGPGPRRLLRFSMYTRNEGATDLVLGVPANRPDQYHYDACHEHYHFAGFAEYTLLDGSGAVVARGAKLAQCVWDWGSWAWEDAGRGAFSCYNQGISVGWEDEYAWDLDCQWIDVTDVAPGQYTVRVDVNPTPEGFAAPRLVERDYTNNADSFEVEIPPP